MLLDLYLDLFFFYSSQRERQNSLWPNDVKEMKTGLLGLYNSSSKAVCVCVCAYQQSTGLQYIAFSGSSKLIYRFVI